MAVQLLFEVSLIAAVRERSEMSQPPVCMNQKPFPFLGLFPLKDAD